MDQAADRDTALRLLRNVPYGVVLIDRERLGDPLPASGFKGVFQPYWRVRPAVEIFLAMEPDRAEEEASALQAGVSHCLLHPLDRFWQAESLEVVRTKSRSMLEVFDRLRSVAPTKSTVLLVGETGTGKGVLARLIHRHSSRRHERFVSIHCGAIPDTLLESELFGHEKGAFTGAVRRKLGKFESARGGTVFLDEVGTITPSAQIELLQVLHEGSFHRVGGDEPIQADVRVIAANNEDLPAMCQTGRFRKDLYYRLNVFPVEVPPLRDRIEDVPTFVEAFLRKLNLLNAKAIHGVDPRVMKGLGEAALRGVRQEAEVVGVLEEGAGGTVLRMHDIRLLGPSPDRVEGTDGNRS